MQQTLLCKVGEVRHWTVGLHTVGLQQKYVALRQRSLGRDCSKAYIHAADTSVLDHVRRGCGKA